jgi:hypothetical protein
MKKIFLLSFVLFALGACSSDGDVGPQGPPGEPGINILGQTFEFENVSFDYLADSNIYATIIDVPTEIEVEPSDAILVYRRQILDGNETWSLIPQNFFLDGGTIQYVYNHTTTDVELLIDGDFDLSNLSADFTTDQFFRFVVVPSNFAVANGVDVADYEAVMSTINH